MWKSLLAHCPEVSTAVLWPIWSPCNCHARWAFWSITVALLNSLYSSIQCHKGLAIANSCLILLFPQTKGTMSDKSDLKAELERKKQRLAQIREEKKRKEEERKKKEVRKKVSKFTQLALVLNHTLHSCVLFVCLVAFCQAMAHERLRLCVCPCKHLCVYRRLVLEFLIKTCMCWRVPELMVGKLTAVCVSWAVREPAEERDDPRGFRLRP